ncbi:UNVERIFIED_CONTAM: hypothetical protein OHV15_00875 [Microbacterium sp. SLM126]
MSASPQPPAASSTVSRGTLIWFGLAIVILAFFAAFLGSWLARSVDTTPAAAEATPTAEQTATAEDYEAALEDILPAGAAVRAGSGVPEAGKGYDGDVYIDVATADVYLFEDGEWTLVGNIRESAAENLTGATGASGATGSQGDQGAQGEQGDPGTQVSLGTGEPAQATCQGDEIYIDTSTPMFYQCADEAWVSFAPPVAGTAPEE